MDITEPNQESIAQKPTAVRLIAGLVIALGIWLILFRLLPGLPGLLMCGNAHCVPTTRLRASLAFFMFEVPKVLLLLTLVVFGVGIVRSFFTPEKTRRVLAGRNESVGNALAAGLGIVTPFCSCSAVPLFIGFVEAGVPLGVTFSFLIAAPLINEVAIGLLLSSFGPKVALLYVGTGLTVAILAGWVIGRLKMERYIEEWVFEVKMGQAGEADTAMTWPERVHYALGQVKEIVWKVLPFIVIGIGVGAGIHGYAPQGLLASFMGRHVWWGVPAAVLIGIPMYSNAAGVIPVVEALMAKGAALGTALAFMMAVIGLSLPETIILRKVLKRQLIAVFLGVVALGIIIVGYLFNYVF